jgi:predicted MFS family arabinose efflux permease
MPADPGRSRTWRSSIHHVVLGPGRQPRLTITHCVHSAAEAFFTVSLAGSIFFSVSPDAARPRVLLFLVLALGPFLVMSPLIGPVVDRVRGGLATTMVATFVLRGILAVLVAANLRTLLLFPLVFGVLVTAKTYTVARNALVPSIADSTDDLVEFKSRLSRTATIAGALAAAAAVAVFTWTSAATTLWVAAGIYALGAVTALRVRAVSRRIEPADVDAVVELVQPDVGGAVGDMMALRAAVGFAVFQFGFSLRAEGEPAWILGLVIGANGLGGFAGTIVSPVLRRHMSERAMFTAALLAAATAMTISGFAYRNETLIGAVFVLGLSASVGRRALDATIQRQAPHARRGQVYAGLETRLELAWVAAACLAVALRAATTIGILSLAAFLVVVTIVHVRRRAGLGVLRPVRSVPLADRLLIRAETLATHGYLDEAVLIARLAATTPENHEAWSESDVRDEIDRARQRAERASTTEQPVADGDVVEMVDRVVDEVPAERVDGEP